MADDLQVSVGVNGIGVMADAGALGVVNLSSSATDDTRTWLAVKATGVGATLTGLEGILSGSLSNVGLKLNQASGFANDTAMTGAAQSLDWGSLLFDGNGDGTERRFRRGESLRGIT